MTAQPLPSVVDGLITGAATLPAAAALPAEAVLTVRLAPGMRNFYYPDGSTVLGEQQIAVGNAGPIPFAIAYDPAAINPDLLYTVFAEVAAGGQRVLTGGVEVITQDRPTTADIALYPLPTARAVSGTVALPADRPAPPAATLTIRLQTPADGVGGPRILGEQIVTPSGSDAIPFSIAVDPATLDPYAAYTLFATLEAPGRLMWNADEQPVLTWGNPATATLTLQAPQNSALLSGTASFPAAATLPPEAELFVQIAYVYSDTIGLVEREQRISPVEGSSVPFAIEYLQGSFQPDDRFALYAFARLHENLLYTTPLIPLNTAAMPTNIALQLAPPTSVQTVRGTLSVDRDLRAPAGAQIFVQLADMRVAYSDGAPIVIATQTIAADAPSPTFAIEYDPVAIDGRTSYAIYAELRADDRVLAASPPYEVITSGNPTEVAVALQRRP